MANVYWAARDLDSMWAPVGNHHFILIVLGKNEYLTIGAKTESGTRFCTMGAFNVDGRLKYQANNSADIFSVREVLNPGKHTAIYKPDYDMERNQVNLKGVNGLALAQRLIVLAANYKRNEAAKNMAYSLVDENCAAWVNSIFKAAGVGKATREKAGEFSGVDWGEEDKIPASYFK